MKKCTGLEFICGLIILGVLNGLGLLEYIIAFTIVVIFPLAYIGCILKAVRDEQTAKEICRKSSEIKR